MPTAAELTFLRVITRGYPAAERQIETCLVAEWNDGYLDVRCSDGPALVPTRKPVMGPVVETGREDAQYLDCIFWLDEHGTIASIEIVVIGTARISDAERVAYFVEAARFDPSRLTYRHPTS